MEVTIFCITTVIFLLGVLSGLYICRDIYEEI